MTHAEHSKIVLFFTLIVLSGFSADGAEIRLQAEHYCRGALVLLGDVADVHEADAMKQAALSHIELFPAPSRVENVRQREIQELLALRGVNLADCRFSGASIVKLHPVGATQEAPTTTARSTSRVDVQALRQRVEQATSPTMILTAVRPINRGNIVQPGDVQLVPAPDAANVRDLLHRVEEAVGKEATRPIAAGQPLDAQALRLPLLVRRGELVTVVARASGVQVRTAARAQDEGSRGDVIVVQSLENQQRYSARVADFRVVEVYARGPSVSTTEPNHFSSSPDRAPRRLSMSENQSPAKLER